MSMEYIRNAYGVPARRGGRVIYTGGVSPMSGYITGSLGSYLRIKLDGHNRSDLYHPTWEIKYVSPNAGVTGLPPAQTVELPPKPAGGRSELT